MRLLAKTFLFLMVFLACYLGLHFWIRARHTVTDDVTKISRLVACEKNEIRSIRVVQREAAKSTELVFKREGGGVPGLTNEMAFAQSEWRYLQPFTGEADGMLLKRLAATWCEIYDPQLLRAELLKPEEGTARMAQMVEMELVHDGNKEVHRVEFGAKRDPSLSILHYKGPSSDEVAEIPSRFQQIASLPPEEFRNLRLMRHEGDNVQSVALFMEKKERFRLERTGADWQLVAGGKVFGVAAPAANQFVNRLSTLRGIGVEAPIFSSEQCAGMKANIEVQMQGVEGRSESLRFAVAPGPVHEIFACSTERTEKLRIHPSLLPYLDIPVRALER